MELASKFVESAIDAVWDPTIRHVGYIINYRKNVTELKGLVANLRSERGRLERKKNDAERNLEIIKEDVEKCIQKVGEKTEEIEKIQKDEGHTKTGCSSGLLPYLWNRHRLGRKAKKMVDDVKPLIEESSKIDRVSSQRHPTPMDAALFNAGYEKFDSRIHTMEEIMKKLEDSTVKMIGVHGPGGVGKSTLIKEIAKEERVKKLFNVVVLVDVTHNPNLRTIQEEIANELGLTEVRQHQSETERARLLTQRLKEKKENTLIILDDLWDKIDLNKIGIPFDDDNDDDLSHMTVKDIKVRIDLDTMKIPHDDNDDDLSHMTTKDIKDPNSKMVRKEKPLGDYKGCKILLTSRDRKVLSDKMDVNDKSISYVRELDDEESLMLFEKVSGIPDEMSQSKHEIVKKYCAGLPMAIVMVGRALKDKSESVWKATLEKLKIEVLEF